MIVGAHGVQGGLRIRSYTASPADVATYGPVEDEAGRRRLALAVAGEAGRGIVIARAKGIDDRDAAEALKGMRLFVPRTAFPPAGADEFYVADLIGLSAERPDGSPLGIVAAVDNFGAGDILEIAPAAGGTSLSVPFTRAVVPVVDLSGGRVVVDPPAALMAGSAAPERRADRAPAGEEGEDR